MQLTYQQLCDDLMKAYLDARRHKRHKPYQMLFEANLENNLFELADSLMKRTYTALPSDCFIITDPKKREVFAAHFRDRIVHHLYYNYTHQMYERTFIHDSYSCIKHRGTHYGVNRLKQHIISESRNYTRPCFVLKMDIRGYFMHINRFHLCQISLDILNKMMNHKVFKYQDTFWRDIVDIDFLQYLTEKIVMIDSTLNCHIKGSLYEWKDLPNDKSLFHSPKGCGLPIGNLTSQLFSNVYLNELDQYMKRELHCHHYGRYVDDFYVVSCDKNWLKSIIQPISDFLQNRLGLSVHEGKTKIFSCQKGVEFLGAFILPYRIYINRSTLQRMDKKLFKLQINSDNIHVAKSLNSYCGILSHWNNYHIRQLMLLNRHKFTNYGMFDYDVKHFYL